MKNSDKLGYGWPPFNKTMLKVMNLICDLRKHNTEHGYFHDLATNAQPGDRPIVFHKLLVPFLYTGTTLAFNQMLGSFPDIREWLNMWHRGWTIWKAHSFNNLEEIPSRPVAFEVARLHKISKTSDSSIGILPSNWFWKVEMSGNLISSLGCGKKEWKYELTNWAVQFLILILEMCLLIILIKISVKLLKDESTLGKLYTLLKSAKESLDLISLKFACLKL